MKNAKWIIHKNEMKSSVLKTEMKSSILKIKTKIREKLYKKLIHHPNASL